MIKKGFFLLLFLSAFALVGDWCQKQTKGFRLSQIFQIKAPQESLPPPSLEEQNEVQAILSQPFYFLKKGQQCFVFLSQDGLYVLKFLRSDKIQTPAWTSLLPSSMTASLQEKKQIKQDLDYASYSVASEELFDETGLVFVQLGQKKPIKHRLELYDNIRVRYFLSLEKIGFILQKNTKDFYPYLKEQLAKGKQAELRPFFSSLALLLRERKQKGISDSDISLEYNMGLLDGKPVLFDIGNLSKKEAVDLEQEARLILSSLAQLSPELASFFKKELLQ